MTAGTYPKRLIEVDLPIKEISAHARREKSIRHGHISTLHIWWARRPLAACRAVICAALWPDPADDLCPQAFRDAAALVLANFAEQVRSNEKLAGLSAKHWSHWKRITYTSLRPDNVGCRYDMRQALLDFIADFANWDASTVPEFLQVARVLTQVSHLALGDPAWRLPVKVSLDDLAGSVSTLATALSEMPRPLVVDPFAGGGAIPLEALRVGADAFASDLNPVAVLLNKVVLEYIPKYGQRLAGEVRRWGQWIKEQAEQELAEFYPKDPDGATPIAYLWARTITCEGPGCGAEVPLMRSLWLAKKGERSVALRVLPDTTAKRVDFEIIQNARAKDVGEGTVRRGAASCPVCGFTTPVTSVRRQLKARRGGTLDARILAVVTSRANRQGRFYRLPTSLDLEAAERASIELTRRKRQHENSLSLVPDESLDIRGVRHTWGMIYGMSEWQDFFTSRQSLALSTLVQMVKSSYAVVAQDPDEDMAEAVATCLSLAVSRQADYLSAICSWHLTRETLGHTFVRQALPIVWDYAEASPLSGSTGDFDGAIDWVARVCEVNSIVSHRGQAVCVSATSHPLPDDMADACITDPPYYDSVPYSYLSDFFYVWLRRSLQEVHRELFASQQVPKDEEIIVDRPHELSNSTHDLTYYERELTRAFAENRRVLGPRGIGTVVFASKTTSSWEAILKAVVDAGWTITGSWPIDTEMEARVAAQGQARLASSIHLVCRPRPDAEQAQSGLQPARPNVGDWRDVLAELPGRIHEWMPRLAREGVVGADAIFACLGPALEIFSRYARVEKASGEQVTLKEYLEYVWAAVSKEALTMIFEGADATGFEEDARLTAMWLWTLSTTTPQGDTDPRISLEVDSEDESDETEGGIAAPKAGGHYLEYDAARKIGQGLGAHLERLTNLVEVKGDKARLLPVAERARHLFGKDEGQAPTRRRARAQQLSFQDVIEEAQEDGGWGDKSVPELGNTVLDRVHQSMILFAAGRADALKQFLVDGKVGNDQRYWRLAQALSALYPSGSDEKRWVDGVLARKKGLGF